MGIYPPPKLGHLLAAMSALGHSRPMRSKPHEHVCPLLPRKRTNGPTSWDVRFVPGADIETYRRGAGHSAPIANVDRRAGDTASGRASNLSQMASASRIRFVIASGCEISAR
jgi:hypothetical protein